MNIVGIDVISRWITRIARKLDTCEPIRQDIHEPIENFASDTLRNGVYLLLVVAHVYKALAVERSEIPRHFESASALPER